MIKNYIVQLRYMTILSSILGTALYMPWNYCVVPLCNLPHGSLFSLIGSVFVFQVVSFNRVVPIMPEKYIVLKDIPTNNEN